MRQQISVLGKLQTLRAQQAKQIQQRINYQRNMCLRYRNNITGLQRLIGFKAATTTHLQRDNQQNYRLTLYKMLDLQTRELDLAEENLTRLQQELLGAMRSEKILEQFIAGKLASWQLQLNQQEQKIQDGLASQGWWQQKLTAT
jgi:flagellar biosynthesis chaperone FliJ